MNVSHLGCPLWHCANLTPQAHEQERNEKEAYRKPTENLQSLRTEKLYKTENFSLGELCILTFAHVARSERFALISVIDVKFYNERTTNTKAGKRMSEFERRLA